MARITVLGGTGYGGSAVVREAARRGHPVTSISRTLPDEQLDGVTYVQGSALDSAVLQDAVDSADVVYVALSPRGDMVGKLEGVVEALIPLAAEKGVRLGYLGGASSLLAEEGGPVLFDVSKEHIPADVLPEVQTGMNALELFRNAPAELDWFFVSPPLDFGAWLPQHSTGAYRLSDDVVLKDDDGKSYITADDLALAVLDEIETPTRRRARFHAAH